MYSAWIRFERRGKPEGELARAADQQRESKPNTNSPCDSMGKFLPCFLKKEEKSIKHHRLVDALVNSKMGTPPGDILLGLQEFTGARALPPRLLSLLLCCCLLHSALFLFLSPLPSSGFCVFLPPL